MLRDYPLFWYEEAGDPLDYPAAGGAGGVLSGADGDRRKPVQPSGRAQPDPLRRHAARSRLAAIRLRAVLRAVRIPAHAGDAEDARLVAGAAAFRMAATRCRSTSRPASGSAATRAIPTCSSPMAASPTACASRTAIITMPDLPGIGFEGKSDLYAEMKALAVVEPARFLFNQNRALACCFDAFSSREPVSTSARKRYRCFTVANSGRRAADPNGKPPEAGRNCRAAFRR